MLKLCDVIVGPVSSNYAKTAARESMLTRGYLTHHAMCAGSSTETYPSLTTFQHSRGVEGMFDECRSLS